jgi:OOP family OmpA-OmpF porin
MNKMLLSASLAFVAATPLLGTVAHADNSNPMDNFYAAGNLGQSNYRDGFGHDSSVFQNVRFGWRWNGYVGPEIGYAYLGRGKGPNDTLKPRAATLGVNGKYNFYQNWFVTGHAGYLRSDSYLTDTASGNRDKSWNNGWFAGAGLGYDVTQNVSLALNYDNYRVQYDHDDGGQGKSNIAAFSASVEYRF